MLVHQRFHVGGHRADGLYWEIGHQRSFKTVRTDHQGQQIWGSSKTSEPLAKETRDQSRRIFANAIWRVRTCGVVPATQDLAIPSVLSSRPQGGTLDERSQECSVYSQKTSKILLAVRIMTRRVPYSLGIFQICVKAQ